jgi:hypothetical protein
VGRGASENNIRRICDERATAPPRAFAHDVCGVWLLAALLVSHRSRSDLLLPRALPEAKLTATECILSTVFQVSHFQLRTASMF